MRGLTCGYGGQRSELRLVNHGCAIYLHGEHSAPAEVRATWRSVRRRDGRHLHRIATSPRQHSRRFTACLTTLHEPCPQGGGTRYVDDRALFIAIVYVLTTGCAWRHLPARAEAKSESWV
jgi:Putative transposase of IS4/5 family (DUF4096)